MSSTEPKYVVKTRGRASSSFDINSSTGAGYNSKRSPFTRKLRNLAMRMRNGVTVTRRSKGLLKFDNVFLGNKAVDWMVAVSVADTRVNAVEIGKEMLRQQIIQRISVKTWVDKKKKERNQNQFKDSNKGYYRFNEALIATYLLHVNVVEASHLLGKQRNGTSSPFVDITTVRERCETRIIEDKVNPVWNEKFTLAINNPESEHLVVRVWNWQEVAKHNFLGEVNIPVAEILRAEEMLRLNAENEHEFDTFEESTGGSSSGGAGGGDSSTGGSGKVGSNGERKRRGSGFKYLYDAPAGGDGRRRRVIELPSSGGTGSSNNNSVGGKSDTNGSGNGSDSTSNHPVLSSSMLRNRSEVRFDTHNCINKTKT